MQDLFCLKKMVKLTSLSILIFFCSVEAKTPPTPNFFPEKIAINGFDLEGNSLFKTVNGYLTLETREENINTNMRIYDQDGKLIWHDSFKRVINLSLSPNLNYVAFFDGEGIVKLDLNEFLFEKIVENSAYFTITDHGEVVFHKFDVRKKGRELPLRRSQLIPAPLKTISIGNSYAQFQQYSFDNPYLHPGVDFMGADYQEVYAVADGYVKAILTTGEDAYWRVAIALTDNAERQDGYLYAHLVKEQIEVKIGDYVKAGQKIGVLYPWLVKGFTHLHFAKINDEGEVWNGAWLTVGNPLPNIIDLNDQTAPKFEIIDDKGFLYFIKDGKGVGALSLSGELDVVCKCFDLANSNLKIGVYQLDYQLVSQENPTVPLLTVPALKFECTLDTYTQGTNQFEMLQSFYYLTAPMTSQGDCNFRDFYHIISKTNGNYSFESEDSQQKFNTRNFPDGKYLFIVTATDASHNETKISVPITINNDAKILENDLSGMKLNLSQNYPNPFNPETTISFNLPIRSDVNLQVYNAKGEIIKSLKYVSLDRGDHSVKFDGTGLNSGVYYYKLEMGDVQSLMKKMLLMK